MTSSLPTLHIIGINTGNSLDSADAILTRFSADGEMEDLAFASAPNPAVLQMALRELREAVEAADGNIPALTRTFDPAKLDAIHNQYLESVAEAARMVLEDAGMKRTEIDLVGFHGQTCAHCPPCNNKGYSYTVQLGSGQMLADTLQIPVVYDFRSDDIMAGGEGAPLAPVHHAHLAENLKRQNLFPAIFCNAGNTSNLTYAGTRDGEAYITGWDAGPFNHFPDQLMREETGKLFDENGDLAATGNIRTDLLETLYESSARTPDGKNFLKLAPPKSSDPQWYQLPPAMKDRSIPLADRLRTACYFSAYVLALSFSFLDKNIGSPHAFVLSGGGWKNKTIRQDFENLILHPEKELSGLHPLKKYAARVLLSEDAGINGQGMEARLFADAARCHIARIPFSTPQTTGARHPVVPGVLCLPSFDRQRISSALQSWMDHFQYRGSIADSLTLWSRATQGWETRKAA